MPTWFIGQIRLYIHQIKADIYTEHPKKIVANKKFDAAIIDAFSKGNVGLGVENIEKLICSTYESLKVGGKLILHYSSEILSDTTASGIALRNLRKWMIEEKCVSSVILLPYDINLNGFITHSAQTALIILEKKEHSSIRMIDASDAYIPTETRTRTIDSNKLIHFMNADSEEYANKIIDASYDEIKNSMVLLPTFRLLQQRLRLQNLPNLVTLKDLLIPYKNEYVNSGNEEIRVVYTNELSDNIATAIKDFCNIEIKADSEGGTLLEKDNLLLFSIYAGVFKCSIFRKTDGVKVMCSNKIQVFEVDSGISDIEFFVSELYEDYVQEQVKALCSPYRSFAMNTQFLMDIMISIPSDSNHNALNSTFERKLKAQEKIIKATGLQLEQLQNKELNDFVLTMRARKHAIGQVLLDLLPAIPVLKEILKQNHGVLKSSDEILDNGTTLEGYLDLLQGLVKQIANMVHHLTDDTKFGTPSEVFLYKLIENYKEDLIEDEFSFDIVYTSEDGFFVNKDSDIRGDKRYIDYKISINPEDFYQVLNNIKSNAQKYGFVHSDKEYTIQISAMPYQLNGKDSVLIRVMNNGESLAKGMTPEKVFVLGEHAGKGDGIGGWQMKNIVEHYGGTIDLINRTDDESYFKIEYQIVLPIIESYDI